MILAQTAEAAGAVAQTLSGRSESLIVVVVGVVLVAFVLWRDSKKQEKDDERQDRRETAQIEKDRKDSESLKTISQASEQSARGIELVAGSLERMEQRQEHDRRAIMSIIESVDARNNTDEIKASNSLRDAKSFLLRD